MATVSGTGGGIRWAPAPLRSSRRRCCFSPATLAIKEDRITGGFDAAERATLHGVSSSLPNAVPMGSGLVRPSEQSSLRFDRLQPSIEESKCKYKRIFGLHVAREAILDEEYWMAAWLRAENHYGDQSGNRYVESLKMQFASQEFHALKKRCNKEHAEKRICLVAVKNDSIKRTVLKSVVGTLDLCVRPPLHGEKYPAEPGNVPFYCKIYQPDQPKLGYLSNVCVAKYARRQGIASNMLLLAMEAAISYGAGRIYIHVHKDNKAAQKLYDQIGFKKVNQDSSLQPSELCLLSIDSLVQVKDRMV